MSQKNQQRIFLVGPMGAGKSTIGKSLALVTQKAFLDIDEEIKIGISKNQALFELDNCKIVTRLLEGEFLNYRNAIPNGYETRIRVNRSSIQDCFERISLISSSSIEKEKKYPVKLFVDIGKKNIDNVTMDILSMGMTNDYEVAIEEGATMVRVGTGIFGERNYNK